MCSCLPPFLTTDNQAPCATLFSPLLDPSIFVFVCSIFFSPLFSLIVILMALMIIMMMGYVYDMYHLYVSKNTHQYDDTADNGTSKRSKKSEQIALVIKICLGTTPIERHPMRKNKVRKRQHNRYTGKRQSELVKVGGGGQSEKFISSEFDYIVLKHGCTPHTYTRKW